jgi:hypothetical protein
MPKPSTTKKTIVDQDTFDRATIKVIHELQKIGFCKNISQVEDYLKMGSRKLHQVLQGERHVSRTFRSVLLNFFVNNYNVNPAIFSNVTQPVFKSEPPTMEEQPEKYFSKKDTNVLSMGDYVKMERLQSQLSDCLERSKELKKEVKYLRDMLASSVNGNTKPDTKTDKAKKGKR